MKRYIREKGSELVDRAYGRAEAGDLHLAFSIWNIGEVIGAFDRYLTRKVISSKEYSTASSDLISETLKLSRMGSLAVLPITAEMISRSWDLVPAYHIYEADALQVAACKEAGSELFLCADYRLLETAKSEGLNPVNVESSDSLNP